MGPHGLWLLDAAPFACLNNKAGRTQKKSGYWPALSEIFANQRDHLYLVARNQNRLRIAAHELEANWDIKVHIASLDHRQPGAAKALVDHIEG